MGWNEKVVTRLNAILTAAKGNAEAAAAFGWNDKVVYLLAAIAEALDVLPSTLDWQDSVTDSDRTAPPAGPADGQRHIVAANPTGAWATKATNIAEWDATAAAWEFTAPNKGYATLDEKAGKLLLFTGTAWQGLGVGVSLADLGLTADAAELNKLDGAGAGVTAGNLTTLTTGEVSDADSLHTHAGKAAANHNHDAAYLAAAGTAADSDKLDGLHAAAFAVAPNCVAKGNGDTLAFGSNNVVSGASSSVNLPAVAAGDVGKELSVTFDGTVAVTIQAPGGVTVSDSAAGGTLADTTAGNAGWATVQLQAISTTAWVIVGFDGTWATT